jgi:hypothetical protein
MRNHLLAIATLAISATAIAPANAAVRFTSTAPAFDRQMNSLGQSRSSQAAKRKLLYVADSLNSVVYVYNLNGNQHSPPPSYTISDGISYPQGITTDKRGNLYVTNEGTNSVTVYAPGGQAPIFTIPNLLTPTDVKVDGFGNVWVSNDPGFGAQSSVLEFPAGSTIPSAEWYTLQGNLAIIGIALADPDLRGTTTAFASSYTVNASDNYTGSVLECLSGAPSNSCDPIATPPLGHTVGIAIERSPTATKPMTFLLVDQYIPGIDVFGDGKLQRQVSTGGTPEYIALNSTRSNIFVSQETANPHVDELSWPGGKLVNQFWPTGFAEYVEAGVAVSPAGTYH